MTQFKLQRRALTLLLVGVTLGGAPLASADEGGAAFWLSGQFSSLAAVPPEVGASVALIPYYYSGNAGGSKSFERGTTLVTGLSAQASLLLVQPGYASEMKVFGGQPYIAMAFGAGRQATQIDATITAPSQSVQRRLDDSITAGIDLYPYAS